jgi:pyridoxal biosynthesis lyase PdxS
LPKEIKEELIFRDSRTNAFTNANPEIIKEACVGAIAVLRLRKLPSTLKNVGTVLKLKPEVIRSYLDEHPDLKEVLNIEGI